jgi:hypothetical protein
MHDLEIKAVFDLGGTTAVRAMGLRNELLAKLRDPDTSSYSFSVGGASVYPILGELVKVDFSRYSSPRTEVLAAFEGLNTKVVEAKESGTDHFPAAGFYRANTLRGYGITGASATVRWKLDHGYPLSEDVIETVVRNAHSSSSFTETIRLEVPVVYSRSWSLTLTAPTLKRALVAYELLRSGEWKPKTTFVDTLPDMQKLRLLQQTVTEED